jgi:hypothetical protein
MMDRLNVYREDVKQQCILHAEIFHFIFKQCCYIVYNKTATYGLLSFSNLAFEFL